ncbi:MAG: hypothetical protein PHE02_11520 [Lachnospiraceae bacterium]|nr:hypothetical protein [Lachnospiraceae bacterium]
MRITNKIMQNNSLTNLNNNKILQDKLNTQMTTEQKISRPSEDPVIAIRALRLRTNLSEVTQYLEKNVTDADGWLSATEDALTTMDAVLKDMEDQCRRGNAAELTSENRAAILEQLKGLRDEVYASGDADYAGRTLFTGYRTNESLSFKSNTENDKYRITENFTVDDLGSITYVDAGSLSDINDGNYDDADGTTEREVTSDPIARIRLAYDELDNNAATTAPKLTIGGTEAAMKTVSTGGDTALIPSMDPYQIMNAINAGNPPVGYENVDAIYVPETGEILITNENKKSIQTNPDTAIEVEYEKSSWEKGDLRPEHYFKCTETVGDKTVDYSGDTQYMEYDVGYNQKIRVNTLASEAFTHDIGRTVDELVRASQDVVDMEATVKKLTAMVDNSEYDQASVDARLAAANKALTLLKDKEKKLYASGITSMEGYRAQASLANTNLGNRDSRLELIKKRLTSQKANFEGLVTENEGVDVSKVAVELKSAMNTYDAALLATSKVVQNSLMNYI